jgi:hypothetical protein
MENFHEPGVGDSEAVRGSGTPTARLRTGAKTLEQLTYPRRAEFFALPVRGMLRTLGKEEESQAEISKNFSGPVTFANDLDCFPVP